MRRAKRESLKTIALHCMDIDCIFNSIIFLNLSDVINVFSISKFISKFNNNYFWKLLYQRDYNIQTKSDKKYHKTYKLCLSLNKFIKNKKIRYDLNYLL